jgi:uncharacterized protein
MLCLIESELKNLIKDEVIGGHNHEHFAAVRDHSIEAAKLEEQLSLTKKCQVVLAAYLHDADDHKIFPENKNYENARFILHKCIPTTGIIKLYDDSDPIVINNIENFIDEIIMMISLVSCSKNGDSEPPEKWMAIPRDCDRLEAIGLIGIERCTAYNNSVGRPLHLPTTEKLYSLDDLNKVVTPERFLSYATNGTSDSMIDHYYDKLLHIGHPTRLKSQNSYILKEAEKRNNLMAEFVINYWKTIDSL